MKKQTKPQIKKEVWTWEPGVRTDDFIQFWNEALTVLPKSGGMKPTKAVRVATGKKITAVAGKYADVVNSRMKFNSTLKDFKQATEMLKFTFNLNSNKKSRKSSR